MAVSWIEKREKAWATPREDRRRETAAAAERLAEHLDQQKVARAPVKAKAYLPPPQPKLAPEAELRRMRGGQIDRWFLTCRRELLAEGLIETILQEDGRWLGDRITAKGLARVRGRTDQ